ncbi:sirohydrochlorin chelatase [Microbacterium terricola]|uniref:sirohydrochlorin chelatase n=1 Tax=Microbacterium terricola TaxID=344163 RepID=UPI0021E7F05A|nr:CbiX/SirB N-terminal domain-containing protein [Microbacterium terricola]UYK41376.1 sirohydrochlorin chelatase [Microbacterium terricola]
MTLIACSHGTRSLAGRAAIGALVDQVRALLPAVEVAEAFVDVQDPRVEEVVDRTVAGSDGPVVVVPLLLSTGFHTRVDIARAVSRHPGRAVAAPALGPNDLLALVLESRLAALDPGADDALILAAAGSTDPAAAADVAAMAARLSECLRMPVSAAYAAGADPRISAAVSAARAAGAARVIVASYVLAPGYFADEIAACGADAVTAPLAPDLRIAGVVVERFTAAAGLLSAASG